jgi:hypothetical protein
MQDVYLHKCIMIFGANGQTKIKPQKEFNQNASPIKGKEGLRW